MAGDTDRIQRLEENQAFAEHTLEQLSSELAELNRRLAEAMLRLERMERRIDRMATDVLERTTEGEAGADTREEPPPSIH